MQRQLDLTRSWPPQVVQRRRQTARIRTPAGRQVTSLHADNYPRSACREQQARHAWSLATDLQRVGGSEQERIQVVFPGQWTYLRKRPSSAAATPPSL